MSDRATINFELRGLPSTLLEEVASEDEEEVPSLLPLTSRSSEGSCQEDSTESTQETGGPDDQGPEDPPNKGGSDLYHTAGKIAAAVVTGGVAVASVPVALGALGFTGTGIAASSIAAKMMSSAAIANGGGVAAGSLVATLQSVGAAGLSIPSKILLGTTGARIGAWLWGSKKK